MRAVVWISLALGLSVGSGYAVAGAERLLAKASAWTKPAQVAAGAAGSRMEGLVVAKTTSLPLFEDEGVRVLLSKMLSAQVQADAGKEGAAVAARHWKQEFVKAFWAQAVSLAAAPELRAQQAIFVAKHSDFFDITPEVQEPLWRELFFTPGVDARSKKILRALMEERGQDPFGSSRGMATSTSLAQ